MVANNIAEVAPAIATLFVFASIVPAAGVGSPLVILIACVGFACHVNSTAEFSRVSPSAGFYATYCARSFGPRTGATVAGGYLLAMFTFYVAVFFQIGVWVSTIVQRSLGFHLDWWIATLVMEAFVVALLVRGIKISVRTAVTLFVLEATMLFVAAFAMLVTSAGYINGAGFNPANIKNGPDGFGLGFVLAIFLFLGASGSSPLAEEARNPRRALPRAIYAATAAAFFIYLLMAWAMVVGLHHNAHALESASFPFLAAAIKAAPPIQYLLYFAGFTSATGVLLGTGNAGSRVLFNVARDGLLPQLMTRTHQRWQTPWPAIVIPIVGTMIATLVVGPLVGPSNAFAYTATLATDLFMVVFIVTNLATIPYFWTRHRDEFSWFRHLAVPLLGAVAFAYPLYESVLPSQAAPYSWFGVAVIIAYAIAFLWGLARSRQIKDMGQLLADEGPATTTGGATGSGPGPAAPAGAPA
ncbi:MAG: APC family permease [Acidimicrobiales bacterium]